MKPEEEKIMDEGKHFPSHFGEVYDAMPEKFEKRKDKVKPMIYWLGTDSRMCVACHFPRMAAVHPIMAGTDSRCYRGSFLCPYRIGLRP